MDVIVEVPSVGLQGEVFGEPLVMETKTSQQRMDFTEDGFVVVKVPASQMRINYSPEHGMVISLFLGKDELVLKGQ